MKTIKLIILSLLVFSAAAFAEELTLTVIDEDLQIPLEGAMIVSWDGKEFWCNSSGKAVLEVPGSRSVVVNISYPGYESKRVAIPPGVSEYTVTLRLGGIMEAQELVVEAKQPGVSETVSGQSVAISGRELTRQAETGIVEDVMSAVKLLPGVGYVGNYATMPTVRGGEPEDIMASLDGFYVEHPFHWGGAFSIFDPKMVESAQLSHGVFSARYGHTISGLLDIHAKNLTDEAEADLSLSTSAFNFSLSIPLGKSGGLAFMGRVTYWDPFIEIAKYAFEEIKMVDTAPYIRSAAFGIEYDLTTDLSFLVNGFFGIDGIGAIYESSVFDWSNIIGFLTTAINYTPKQNILLKARVGAGFYKNDMNGVVIDEIGSMMSNTNNITSDRTISVQGRFDLDWDLGSGFLFSAGVEERYNRWDRLRYIYTDRPLVKINLVNQGLNSSLYTSLAYQSTNSRLNIEAGIRVDHFALFGEDITLNGIPAVNPRINFSVNVLENKGIINTLTLTAGTGLFSSVSSSLQNFGGNKNLDPLTETQNFSWNSIIGAKVDFEQGYSIMLEGYIKRVFRRVYTKITDPGINLRENDFYFDGEAIIWGFDLMLQKFTSRYLDGWISYSYIDAKYLDPQSTNDRNRNHGGWYYPGYHRFHTLNVIINYTPIETFQITARFSFASGVPIPRVNSMIYNPPNYDWVLVYDDYSRTDFNMPLDIKLSLFGQRKNNKVLWEAYVNIENILSLFYKPKGYPHYDRNAPEPSYYQTLATYELPIPMLNFGAKWSY